MEVYLLQLLSKTDFKLALGMFIQSLQSELTYFHPRAFKNFFYIMTKCKFIFCTEALQEALVSVALVRTIVTRGGILSSLNVLGNHAAYHVLGYQRLLGQAKQVFVGLDTTKTFTCITFAGDKYFMSQIFQIV